MAASVQKAEAFLQLGLGDIPAIETLERTANAGRISLVARLRFVFPQCQGSALGHFVKGLVVREHQGLERRVGAQAPRACGRKVWRVKRASKRMLRTSVKLRVQRPTVTVRSFARHPRLGVLGEGVNPVGLGREHRRAAERSIE